MTESTTVPGNGFSNLKTYIFLESKWLLSKKFLPIA